MASVCRSQEPVYLESACDDFAPMGSLCSKSSNYEGGDVLGSGPARPANANTANSVSTQPGPSQRIDPRTAAAEAAERRLQAAQARGTNSGNPKQGKLASQLAKQNSQRPGAQSQAEPAQLVWD